MAQTNSKKSVKEIEEELTYLSKNDINNPQMYELLKQLAYIYIYQNKYVYGYSDVEAVCHDVAADTWMRLLSNKTEISHWMYYIGRSIKLSYVTKQRKIEHEVIETDDNPELRREVISMCTGSHKSFSDDFNTLHKVSFLENIDALIRETLMHSKFKQESKEWLWLYTNISLSLYYDKPVYFRLPNSLKPYVTFLIKQFKQRFIKSEFTQQLLSEHDDDLPSLLFYDELEVKDRDKRRDV